MVRNEIKQQAIYLSRLLVETEEYQNLIEAQTAVKGDPVAYQIMMDYQKLGMEANNNMMRGITMSPGEMKAIAEQEARIQGNKKLQHWSECQTIFSKMMEEVLQIIQQALTGETLW